MTLIKICGLTNLEDALAAIDAGADYLGFNFYKGSPRYIAPDAARSLVEQLPAKPTKVGVFVNEAVTEIERIVVSTGMQAVQLHGDESPETCKSVADIGCPIIKAFRVTDDLTSQRIQEYTAQMVLLDAAVPGMYGGTGTTVNWSKARTLRDSTPSVLLAGGLSVENVTEAIAAVAPAGVDVSSSLESEPGRKDHARMREFVSAVRAA